MNSVPSKTDILKNQYYECYGELEMLEKELTALDVTIEKHKMELANFIAKRKEYKYKLKCLKKRHAKLESKGMKYGIFKSLDED